MHLTIVVLGLILMTRTLVPLLPSAFFAPDPGTSAVFACVSETENVEQNIEYSDVGKLYDSGTGRWKRQPSALDFQEKFGFASAWHSIPRVNTGRLRVQYDGQLLEMSCWRKYKSAFLRERN